MTAPRFCLALLLVLPSALPAAAPPADPTPGQIRRWIEELGDDSFAAREAAMKKLAGAGATAETPLQAALRNPDVEIARRAKTLLEQFRWGIYPDTPPSVVKLIRSYQSAASSEKRDLVQKLLASGPHGCKAMTKIARYEEDPQVRKVVFADIAASMGKVAPVLIDEQNRPALEGLLEVALSGDVRTGAPNYAAYYLLTNQLPARIAEWEARAKKATVAKAENEVLAYLYRANGDLARARKAAIDAERNDLLLAILYEAADWKALASRPDLIDSESEPTQIGYWTAFARLSGDRKKSLEFLVETKKRAEPFARRHAHVLPFAKVLFLNGEGAAGADLMVAGDSPARMGYDILVAQSKFAAAFALVEKARKDESKELPTLEILEARSLHLLGEKDKALAVFEKYAKKIVPGAEVPWGIDLVECELAVGRRDVAFAVAAKILVASADNRTSEQLFELFEKLFGKRRANDAYRLRQLLRRVHDKDDDTKIMPRLRAFLKGKATAKEIDALFTAVPFGKDIGPEVLAAEWRIVGDIALAHKSQVKAARAYKEAKTVRAGIRLGDLLAEQKQWRQAADAYLAAYRLGLTTLARERGEDEGESLPALALYLSGHALTQAGDAKTGKERTEKAHLLPLGDTEMRYDLSRALAYRKHRDGARREQELLRRLGEPVLTDPGSYFTGEGMRAGAIDAMSRKKWLEASDGFEQSFLRVLQPNMNFTRANAYVAVPAFIFYLRARGLVVAGRFDDAKVEIARSQSCIPGQVELAIHVVPELDLKGRKADADALFASSLAPYADLLKTYPRSAFVLNQVAWISACCRRDLDQASKHVRKALDLDPDNPAYLDTQAEVLFQLGKQAEAIAAQKKAIALSPDRKYFVKQLKRIEAGDAKAPRPTEEE
jgi:tetratricopeptide (TPR) repeat protein